MRPTLSEPVSIKLRAAICHMDFEVINLSAVPTPAYLAKIERVETVLSGLQRRPQLLSFPECCASEVLIQRATNWAANWDIVTICGTRFNPTTSRIEAVIVHRGGIETAQKQRLSPYDQPSCSSTVRPGAAPGMTFTLPVQGPGGHYYDVGVGVLICYDFRFQYLNPSFANWGKVQVLVVPMWDRRFKEPQEKAGELARRFWTRCLLVSKAENQGNAFARYFPRTARFIRRFQTIEHWAGERLPSTGHGPINEANLCKLREFGARRANSQLWERRAEGFFIGDYEVGVPVSLGHDNAYGTGFHYDNFQPFNLG